MSYKVKFWSLSKRSNSTLTPTTGSTDYDCIVKNGTGILHPKIELDLGLSSDPSTFNYCYIANFERYYYVNEWTFDRGLWTAVCNVDVLSTYKSQIGSTSMYVLRASASYDGSIMDNLYPTKSGCSYTTTSITSPYNQTGCYVIGVVNGAGMYGSVSYYALSRGNMATLMSGLMTNTVGSGSNPLNGFDLADASLELQLSLIDPIQYIRSAIWLPVPTSSITSDQTENGLAVFNWVIPSVTAYRISNPSIVLRTTVSLTNHPDYASRGSYVNCSPYTLATLFMPPFGVVELDTSVTCNASTLNADIYLDANTGDGDLVVSCNGVVMNKLTAKVGVPVQISQVSRDYMGALTSVASGVTSAVAGVATGGAAGIAGAVGSGISAIGDAVKAIVPRSNTIGSGGNFSILTAKSPELDYQFFRPVNDDITHNGRPYCQVTTPSSLGGYMLIQDGDVAIPGTREEADQIRTWLETGFYYE